MPGIELLLNARSLFSFTFTFRDSRSHVLCYTMERQYLPHILQDQMFVSGAQDLQIIRHRPPYSVYVVSEFLCTVM